MENQQPQAMVACKREGNFTAGVKDIKIIKHRFPKNGNENAIEVKISFITQQYETGDTYLSFSANYIQQGTHKGKRECDLSMETLEGLGMQRNEFANIRKLIGIEINLYGKLKDGSIYFFLSSFPEQEIDAGDAEKALSLIFGNQAAPQAQQTITPPANPQQTFNPAPPANGNIFPQS